MMAMHCPALNPILSRHTGCCLSWYPPPPLEEDRPQKTLVEGEETG